MIQQSHFEDFAERKHSSEMELFSLCGEQMISNLSDKPSFSGEKPGLSETCGYLADNPSFSVKN